MGSGYRALSFLAAASCAWSAPLVAAGAAAQRIDPPKIVKHVDPVYPEIARQARIQGVVTIEATIGADGKVKTAKVVQSIPLLDEAALAAVRQWEYTPTIVGGVAKPVIMTVKVNFALTDPTVPTSHVARLMLTMQHSFEQVQSRSDLSREAVRALIEEGIAAAEAILASPEIAPPDFRIATMGKGMGLELQAERLAQTRPQRIALLTESARWIAPVAEFKNGAPPAPRKLSAAEIDDMEWRAVSRWNNRLADDGKVQEAIAGFNKYLAERPGFHEVHAQIAALLIRAGRDSKDPARRTSSLEQAAVQLQHVVDLAPTASERNVAVEQLLGLYGPEQLNRPGEQEAVARAMVKRSADVPAGHYILATVLLRAGKSSEAESVLRGARAAIKPTAVSRAEMAGQLVQRIVLRNDLPAAAERRLFDEATALLLEAEKLNPNAREVLEARMSWLNLSADRFEKDPARAAAQREQARRLAARAQQLPPRKS
jgi:TonB family protein